MQRFQLSRYIFVLLHEAIYYFKVPNKSVIGSECGESSHYTPFCIKGSPYPRAYASPCCKPVYRTKEIKERYRNGELRSLTEYEYLAEFCSKNKDCVELRYPPRRLPRSSTLPKYLRTDDDDDGDDNDENTALYDNRIRGYRSPSRTKYPH